MSRGFLAQVQAMVNAVSPSNPANVADLTSTEQPSYATLIIRLMLLKHIHDLFDDNLASPLNHTLNLLPAAAVCAMRDLIQEIWCHETGLSRLGNRIAVAHATVASVNRGLSRGLDVDDMRREIDDLERYLNSARSRLVTEHLRPIASSTNGHCEPVDLMSALLCEWCPGDADGDILNWGIHHGFTDHGHAWLCPLWTLPGPDAATVSAAITGFFGAFGPGSGTRLTAFLHVCHRSREDRDLDAVTALWTAEEMAELVSCRTPEQAADAVFDALGVLICRLDSLYRRNPGLVKEAHRAYVAGQGARGRKVDVPHHHVIETVLERISGLAAAWPVDMDNTSREILLRKAQVGSGATTRYAKSLADMMFAQPPYLGRPGHEGPAVKAR
jgi:hypothetical protein